MLAGTELMSVPATECKVSSLRQVALDVTKVQGILRQREAIVSQSKSEFWPQK